MKQLACLAVLVLAVGRVSGGFVVNFDMDGNYNQYLYSVTNAKVWDERANGLPVRYRAPTTTGVWGEVVYKYDLSFQIGTASLYANLLANRPGDQTFVDVSADGVNYTTVESGYVHPLTTPPYSLPVLDLSSILHGSTTAYVRARLFGQQLNSNIFSSQFLRTADDEPFFQAPYVYQFQADPVPVPTPPGIVLAGLGLLTLLGYRWTGPRRNKAT